MALIDIRNICKTYDLGDVKVNALCGVSTVIDKGEFVAIMGPSGSGKSTFMNILGCLDTPTTGKYLLDGVDVEGLSRDDLAELRNKKIGFIFQGFNLLSRTSAIENVELPLIYAGMSSRQRRDLARQALDRVGLANRYNHLPNQLSGGQQQRVAIARALVNNAEIILADEPTGNLDTKTSVEIMELLVTLNQQSGITIILVTHEPDIALYGRRKIRFLDGSIVEDV
ncbi:MAG: ABC transporter ATP-binding protein [Thermodesulfovibrionales bacterium]|nr:ABC transporter ATP-binding protein [Thermodesulfovibrionales bacterium]